MNETLDSKTAHPERILSEGNKLVAYRQSRSQISRNNLTASFASWDGRGSSQEGGTERRRLGIGQDRPWVLPRTASWRSCVYYLRMSWDKGLLWKWVLGHFLSSRPPLPEDVSRALESPLTTPLEASPLITWTSALFMVRECSVVNFSTVPPGKPYLYFPPIFLSEILHPLLSLVS